MYAGHGAHVLCCALWVKGALHLTHITRDKEKITAAAQAVLRSAKKC
jgi:hypothetical protein